MATYAEYMNESKALLELASMSTAVLTQGTPAINAAVTQAKARLQSLLMSKCGDTAQAAADRVAKGSVSIRSRISTCQSAAAVVAAAQAQARASAEAMAEAAQLDAAELELQRCAGYTPAQTKALRNQGKTFLIGRLYNTCQRQTYVTGAPAASAAPTTAAPASAAVQVKPFPWTALILGATGLGAVLVVVLVARRS